MLLIARSRYNPSSDPLCVLNRRKTHTTSRGMNQYGFSRFQLS
jgi:hypothetical protein